MTKFLEHLGFSDNNVKPFLGDQSNRRGLPTACAHGLPCGAAPAHVGLLGEGSSRETHVQPDPQHVG